EVLVYAITADPGRQIGRRHRGSPDKGRRHHVRRLILCCGRMSGNQKRQSRHEAQHDLFSGVVTEADYQISLFKTSPGHGRAMPWMTWLVNFCAARLLCLTPATSRVISLISQAQSPG